MRWPCGGWPTTTWGNQQGGSSSAAASALGFLQNALAALSLVHSLALAHLFSRQEKTSSCEGTLSFSWGWGHWEYRASRVYRAEAASQKEKENSKSLCMHLSVCLPHSLNAELRKEKKQECAGRWPEIEIRREKKK